MLAEHILGLSYSESAGRFCASKRPAAAASIRRRFQAIQLDGYLRPRGRPRDVNSDDHGSTFDLDLLAGDDRYIFLSYGPRYRDLIEPDLCYGFAFDAEQLVHAGALVGPDLLDDYEALASEIAESIDRRLPPLAQTSDEEIAEFAGLFGEHEPELLAYIQQQSASRYHDIMDAMRSQDRGVPGAKIALWLFRQRVSSIQEEQRKRGLQALEPLRGSEHAQLEILFPGHLPIAWSVATVQAGEVKPR